jgi:4,5-DOPA dioxygenase extradiol
MARMPVGFVGHGAPTLALEAGEDLRRWRRELPEPSAILVVSAHWQDAPITLSATRPTELVYDFYGFPRALYQVRHDAPPAPELASKVEGLLLGQETARSSRGLDHGAWVPLRHLDPEAQVPVLQLSMPATATPKELVDLGASLQPLRDEGVWILCSGNLVHNLRQISFDPAPAPSWAVEFDAWVEECLSRGDVDALCDHRQRGPGSRMAHPTDEHYRPLLVALGASGSDLRRVRYPIAGFEYGSISRRAVSFG